MKIVFSGNTAWSMYNFRREVFKHFINNGHEVYVLAPKDTNFTKLIEEIGCHFINISIERKGTNPITDVLLIKQYYSCLKKIHPDCCYFYTIKPNIYGGIAASMLGITFFAVTTGLGYIFNSNNFTSIIAKLLYKFSFRKALEVWFLNNDDIKSFLDNGIIDKNKAKLLNGEGIDTSHFSISNNEKNNFSFLLMSRLLWDKGVGIYAEAAKKLKAEYPDVEFNLLGAIDTENPSGIAKNIIEKWHNNKIINYLGETNDVRPYINESSCVVLPSFYREGIPFCLMEGAASGKPIITTDNTGCKELVIDGVNGFICKKNDVEDLIIAMKKVLLLPHDKRIEMGMNGRKFMIKNFDIKIILNKYDESLLKIRKK